MSAPRALLCVFEVARRVRESEAERCRRRGFARRARGCDELEEDWRRGWFAFPRVRAVEARADCGSRRKKYEQEEFVM